MSTPPHDESHPEANPRRERAGGDPGRDQSWEAELADLLRTHAPRIAERLQGRLASRAATAGGTGAGSSAGLPVALAEVITGADPGLLVVEARNRRGGGAALADILEELDELERAALAILAEACGGLGMELVEALGAPVRAAQNVAIAEEMAGLRAASLEDPLTGLGNRRALGESLNREAARMARVGHHFSVVVVDLDNLKAINDRAGHAAGDQALIDLADAVRSSLRASDSAFRLGGDEFVVLLPETDLDGAAHLMQRINLAGAPSHSWGAACSPGDGVAGDVLLAAADRRLYEQRRLLR